MDDDEAVRAVGPLVEKIRPILAEQDPGIQGAVLCDLLAMWLAGFVVPGDVEATKKLRDELLAAHVAEVPGLIAINAKMIGTDLSED